MNYHYSGTGQQIICSVDAISQLGAVVDRLGASRAMVVCGPNILAQSNVVQRAQEALGTRAAGLFSGIAPHSPVEVLAEAVAAARELEPDVLVAVGGGSTSDTCKGIAMMLAEGGDLHDYEVRFEPPDKVIVPDLPHQKMPIVAVGTTMGAAELSGGGGGFTDKSQGRKILISGQGTLPKVVIIDGEATGHHSQTHRPFHRHGPVPHRRGKRVLNWSSPDFRLLGVAYNQAVGAASGRMPGRRHRRHAPGQDGGVHDHAGPARFGPEHRNRPPVGRPVRRSPRGGQLHPVATHHEVQRRRMRAQAGVGGPAMGIDCRGMGDQEAAIAAADGVAELCRSLGLPLTLREVDVPDEGLELIASATLTDRSLATNPKPVYDAGPIMSILRAAW